MAARSCSVLVLVLAALTGPTPAAEQQAPAARVDFNREIRPLLSDRCFRCHGPDSAKRKAELRLDVRDGAFRKLDDGWAIVKPRDSAHSELVRRTSSDDVEEMMPPPDSNLSLTDAEKALLARWVAEGADYRPHWSLAPVAAVPPPSLRGGAPDNPIDAFVRARLDKEGVTPAPRASSEILLRRLAFNLTGLPPTPAEIDAFVADRSPDAYERAVDRYLASPAYGERMAMDWLDLARYADTYGYQNDAERDMSPYRDWVIGAFNQNLPYDAFLTWQLAGDLLPERHARPAPRHRVQPAAPADQRRRQHRGGVPHRVRRSTASTRSAPPCWPHARVRPLPRSQVRPDHAARLLLAVRLLQQHRRVRPVLAFHQCHAEPVAALVAGGEGGRASAAVGRDAGARAAAAHDVASGPGGVQGAVLGRHHAPVADRAPGLRHRRRQDRRRTASATPTPNCATRRHRLAEPPRLALALQRRQLRDPSRRPDLLAHRPVLAGAAAQAHRASGPRRRRAPVARLDRRRQPRLRADARSRPSVLRADSLLAGERDRRAGQAAADAQRLDASRRSPTTARAARQGCGSTSTARRPMSRSCAIGSTRTSPTTAPPATTSTSSRR